MAIRLHTHKRSEILDLTESEGLLSTDNATITGLWDFTHATGLKVDGTAFTSSDIGRWNTAFGWGNHASAGYGDAIKANNESIGGYWNFANASGVKVGGTQITSTKIGQWNTAFGWGNHASAGYAASGHNHDATYVNVSGDVMPGDLDFSGTGNDLINFTGAAANVHRGIAFNNRSALTAHNTDGWLRLNSGAEFSNGVLTPGNFRCEGVIRVDTTRGIKDVTGSFGTIQTDGAGVGDWEGYSIQGRMVFMEGGSGVDRGGIYDDVNNAWMVHCYMNGQIELNYSGAKKLETTNTGVDVTGKVRAVGDDVVAYAT